MGANVQGADLRATEFQGADLAFARLHGAHALGYREDAVIEDERSLEAVIEEREGEDSEFSTMVLSGGLLPSVIEEAVDGMTGYLSEDLIGWFRRTAERHVGEARESDETTVRIRGGAVGAYGREEAARWIVQYRQHICEAFAFDPGFLIRMSLARRVRVPEEIVENWARAGSCIRGG